MNPGLALLMAAGAMLVTIPTMAAPACDCTKPELPMCTASPAGLLAGIASPAKVAALPALVPQDNDLRALNDYHFLRRFEETRGRATGHASSILARPLGKVSLQGVQIADLRNKNFQLQLDKLVRLNGGVASLAVAEPKMIYPGDKEPESGRIPNTLAGTPAVVEGNCVRVADTADWLPGKKGRLGVTGGRYFPEVARILTRRAGSAKTGVCAMVLLSPRWAVTALHCVAIQTVTTKGKPWPLEAGLDEIRFFQATNGEEPLQALVDCFDDAKVGTPACPLRKLRARRIIWDGTGSIIYPAGSKVPQKDLALIELDGAETLPVYPRLVAKLRDGEPTVTLVGVGITNASSLHPGFELQYGWTNTGAVVPRTSPPQGALEYAWVPRSIPNGSTVCGGDSGGAVFAGFESGVCRCDGNKKPMPQQRDLLGVVSYLEVANGVTEVSPETCRGATRAAAVVPGDQLGWICKSAPDLPACK